MIHWTIIMFVLGAVFMLFKAIKDDDTDAYYLDPRPGYWLIGLVAWIALWGGIWWW